MEKEELLELQEKFLIGTYSAENILVEGKGAYVWDISGKKYLDFTSGISVCNLGHCHPRVSEAIRKQSEKLVHVSNLFINENQPKLAACIAERSFGGQLFFANSGAEANEGMIKFARKWGNSRGKNQIIYMKNSFHGRSLATLAATDKPNYRDGFSPNMGGFVRANFDDIQSLKTVLTKETAAIMLEPIQGEGGIHTISKDVLSEMKEICISQEILLLFDEVQCGMGRTGQYFAYQNYGIEPDAMSMAKALGNGFPIGAFEIQRKWADILPVGSHASTFGGSPLACAASLAVFQTIDEDQLLVNCREMGYYLNEKLRRLSSKFCRIKDIRGLGLMVGIEVDVDVKDIQKKAQDRGLLILSAGKNVLRLMPPFIITQSDIDIAIDVLDQVFNERLL